MPLIRRGGIYLPKPGLVNDLAALRALPHRLLHPKNWGDDTNAFVFFFSHSARVNSWRFSAVFPRHVIGSMPKLLTMTYHFSIRLYCNILRNGTHFIEFEIDFFDFGCLSPGAEALKFEWLKDRARPHDHGGLSLGHVKDFRENLRDLARHEARVFFSRGIFFRNELVPIVENMSRMPKGRVVQRFFIQHPSETPLHETLGRLTDFFEHLSQKALAGDIEKFLTDRLLKYRRPQVERPPSST